MKNEVVMAVVGTLEGFDPPPRGIKLIHFLKFSWGYRLQEP
jgi:hypothetical protein